MDLTFIGSSLFRNNKTINNSEVKSAVHPTVNDFIANLGGGYIASIT